MNHNTGCERRRLATGIMILLAGMSLAAPIEHFSNETRIAIQSPAASSDFARPLITGDFDGDGRADIVVGQSNSPNFANAYIVRGQPLAGPTPQMVDLASTPASKRLFGPDQTINLPTALAVGDLNGDGYDDLALTAPIMSPLGRTHAGQVYVVLGGPNFFDGPVDLNLSAPPAGVSVVTFYGAVTAGDLGSQSAFGGMDAYGLAMGDLNGDGIDDLVVGAHLASPQSRGTAGQVYVFFGRTTLAGGQNHDLASANVRIDGSRQYYETGTRVAVGDITGDGIADLIIACDTAGEQTFFLSSEGIVYVLRGQATWSASYDLRNITPDLKILGRRDGDGLGSSVALADMNRDGILDLCLGATGGGSIPALNDDFGSVAVFFGGAALGTLPRTINMATTAPNIEWTGPSAFSNLAWAMTAGDFNGDGHTSLAASAVFANYGSESTNGFIEVLDSRATWPANALVRSALGEHDHRVIGPPQGRYGFALVSGDTDGDGIDELVIGAPFHGNGEVHVHQLVPTPASAQGNWTMYE
ncbi:MAG: FG-GAP repeat protein [Candidatus Sumerlaeia bacterium]|nr:FG-GAP repeat protein [Candidatus Sumerlaeia bacterium]